MNEHQKQGWFEDPSGRHQYRWFSAGEATDLVKDGQVTGTDVISMHDAELYEDLVLKRPADLAPRCTRTPRRRISRS
jgi:hypothetical protein